MPACGRHQARDTSGHARLRLCHTFSRGTCPLWLRTPRPRPPYWLRVSTVRLIVWWPSRPPGSRPAAAVTSCRHRPPRATRTTPAPPVSSHRESGPQSPSKSRHAIAEARRSRGPTARARARLTFQACAAVRGQDLVPGRSLRLLRRLRLPESGPWPCHITRPGPDQAESEHR